MPPLFFSLPNRDCIIALLITTLIQFLIFSIIFYLHILELGVLRIESYRSFKFRAHTSRSEWYSKLRKDMLHSFLFLIPSLNLLSLKLTRPNWSNLNGLRLTHVHIETNKIRKRSCENNHL